MLNKLHTNSKTKHLLLEYDIFKKTKRKTIKFNSLDYFGRVQDDLRVIAKLRMTTDQMRRK